MDSFHHRGSVGPKSTDPSQPGPVAKVVLIHEHDSPQVRRAMVKMGTVFQGPPTHEDAMNPWIFTACLATFLFFVMTSKRLDIGLSLQYLSFLSHVITQVTVCQYFIVRAFLNNSKYEYDTDSCLNLVANSVCHIWQGYGTDRYPSILQIAKLKCMLQQTQVVNFRLIQGKCGFVQILRDCQVLVNEKVSGRKMYPLPFTL